MNRRSFLQGILAAGVAPAFVGSSILMPVRKLWATPFHRLDASCRAMTLEVARQQEHVLKYTLLLEGARRYPGAHLIPGAFEVIHDPREIGLFCARYQITIAS